MLGIPLKYNVRNLFVRKVTTTLTVLGIGLVVAVFLCVMALGEGLTRVFTASGSDSNVLVLRQNSQSERQSGISRDQVPLILTLSGIAPGADGKPLESFDAVAVAQRVTKSKKSKWYGIPPEKIIELWNAESDRAVTLGTFYHNQRESDICSLSSIEKEGVPIPVYIPIQEGDSKKAPNQKLTDGVYPEHMVYLKSAAICGQSDLVEVVNGKVFIIDYKTNKEIKKESFKDWEGVSKKMLYPVSHLDDCNFNHYSLQLSIYMYIILKHNPKLKAGEMWIHHILFEEEGKDEYAYPITKYAMPLRGHFHNTRNMGLANAYAAVAAGVGVLDASIGGIGRCPFAPAATGNIPTEDLLYMLQRSGYETGVSLDAAIATGHWLQERLGRPVPGMLVKAGSFPRPTAPPA